MAASRTVREHAPPPDPIWFDRLGPYTKWRPRLAVAGAIALVFLVEGAFLPAVRIWPTAVLVAVDVGTAFYLAFAFQMIHGAEPRTIAARAAQVDVGKYVFLAIIAGAGIVSLAAIYGEISAAAGDDASWWQFPLAVATILLSWLLTQVTFALHYAHEFYGQGTGKPGGLIFPKGSSTTPDYWDFLYFAFVVGMTSQVSDVAVADRKIRHTVTWHGVYAFFFNVALLALVVNLAADTIKSGVEAAGTEQSSTPATLPKKTFGR